MTQQLAIEEALARKESSWWQNMLSAQAFWITFSVFAIAFVMSFVNENFLSTGNFFNITRNFAFIGIMAIGMTAVIITAGIDLSVGSTLGLVAMVSAVAITSGWSMEATIAIGIATSLAVGFVNGFLIAYIKLNPFIVTLGMLSIARSLTLVITNAAPVTLRRSGEEADRFRELLAGSPLGISTPVWILAILAIVVTVMMRWSAWGRYIYAIGGNEQAARLNGIRVDAVKVSAYMLSALTAGISGLLVLAWAGSALSNFGQAWELRVIASTVIGGANLLGGAGSAYGGVIGAALIEIIRNSLLLAGVNTFWQGTFVGLFILFAVILERIRRRT